MEEAQQQHATNNVFVSLLSPTTISQVANNVKATANCNLPETSTKSHVDGAITWKGFE
jgi:hypothetical protein